MDWNSIAPGCIVNGVATIDCLRAVWINLLRALYLFMGTAAVIMFIIGGYRLINSSADPKSLEAAKHTFSWGLLGIAIIALSYLILTIIAYVTNTPCILTFGFGC